jgi:hypothetical protein
MNSGVTAVSFGASIYCLQGKVRHKKGWRLPAGVIANRNTTTLTTKNTTRVTQ